MTHLAGGFDGFAERSGRRFAVENVSNVLVLSRVHDEGAQPAIHEEQRVEGHVFRSRVQVTCLGHVKQRLFQVPCASNEA